MSIREVGLIISLFLVTLTSVVVFCVTKLLYGLRSVNYMPGLRIPFAPLNIPAALLPTTWWNPGLDFVWLWRGHFYEKSENISVVPFLIGPPTIVTSNLDVCRQVTPAEGQKSDFKKPKITTRSMEMWGVNVLTANGDMWRKHRRIMTPAFNNTLYQTVWRETINVYQEMFEAEGWADKKTIHILDINHLADQLGLLVIGRCGFGFDFRWDDSTVDLDGTPSIQESLKTVASFYMVFLLPRWFQHLPFKNLKMLKTAYDRMTSFMYSQVAEKRADLNGQTKDLMEEDSSKRATSVFDLLVRANDQELTKLKLSNEELVSNIFVLLLAGHETTSSTLAMLFGMLALYPDIQDEIFQQITEVVGHCEPSFDDYQKLNKVRGAFYEALRLFPPAFAFVREAAKDTVLIVPNPRGTEGTTSVPVLKGTTIVVDMIGIQYNPRYFENPFEFRPSRWYLTNSESEAISAFSVGPRACIGRRFATTEAVCFIALLLRDWRIEPILKDGETIESLRGRVGTAKPVLSITMKIPPTPIRLVRRE